MNFKRQLIVISTGIIHKFDKKTAHGQLNSNIYLGNYAYLKLHVKANLLLKHLKLRTYSRNYKNHVNRNYSMTFDTNIECINNLKSVHTYNQK